MAARLRLALTVAVLCAAAMVAIVIVIQRSNAGASTTAGAVKTDGFYGFRLPADFPAVDFAIPDQDHRTIRLGAFAGRVVVATFVYSTCTDTCPLIVAQIRNAIDELPHPVPALAISVDPGQDTPAHVRAFLAKQHVQGMFDYLVAARARLAPIWRQFGVRPQQIVNSSTSDHSVDVVIFDKSGRARVGYNDLTAMDPDAIAADVRTLEAQPLPATPPRRVAL